MKRKDFIARIGLLSVGAIGGAALLNACAGDEQSNTTESADTGSTEAQGSDPEASSLKACGDLNNDLSEKDLRTRKALGYSDQSNNPEQTCAGCSQFLAEKFDGPCGGCNIITAGAVASNGRCNSWAPRN